jgi:tryptophan synthase alpha chain
MGKIIEKFEELKKNNKKGLIVFLTAGDPDLETTYKLVKEIEKNGADIIELGIPFSDPIADGPIIQSSSQRALKQNINIPKILKLVKKLKKEIKIPIVLMSYYNPIFNYGVEKFINDCKNSKVGGLIISDLLPEEADEIKNLAKKNEIDLIFLLSPTTEEKRMRMISKSSTSFIYCISRTGVTGLQKELPRELKNFIKKVRKITKKPIGIGFGISNKEQAKEVAKISDAVIVGSAVVKLIEENLVKPELLVKKVGNLIKELKTAIS